MEGSGSSGRGEDGESVAEGPDEAWVAEHLKVTRLDDEHGGGVEVEVASLAAADVDVAKAGAWLQAHGGEVKAFEASWSACAVCTVCVLCTCGTLTLDVWLSAVWAGVRRAWLGFTPAQDDTRPGGMHGVDTIDVATYVFGAALLLCACL